MKVIKVFLKKKKKWQHGREQNKNLQEDEKQKFVEYRNKCYKMRKNALLQSEETVTLKSNDLENSIEKTVLKL